MTDVVETLDPLWRKKGSAKLVAGHDALDVGEFPDVDHHPWHVAADEDDHDAEQHQEHVHLLPQLPVRPESLGLDMAEVHDDPGVDEDERQEGDDCSAEESEVRPIELDVVAVLSKLCCSERWDTDTHLLVVNIIVQDGSVQLKVVEPILWVDWIYWIPVDFALQELRDVEEEGQKEDWQDVEPGFSVVRGEVEWVADA